MKHHLRRIVCIAALVAFAQAAQGGTTYWTGATDSWWNKAANWTTGVPAATTYAYVDNGGKLAIDATITAVADSFYLGEGGRGNDLGGTLTQSGGSLTATNMLDVVAPEGKAATYTLTGGTVAASTLSVAGPGMSLFDHSGGKVSVTGWLTVGGDFLGTQNAGTYSLSATGQLTAEVESVKGLGAFFQSNGTNTVSYLEVASGTTYTKTGGMLTIARGWLLDGTLDFGHVAGTITAGDALVDLSQATILNGDAASGGGAFVAGPKSMVILPVGFDDKKAFPGGFAAPNLTHTAGTTMNLTAGQEWNGWGRVDDHVTCAGTLDAVEADGWLTLKTGLAVSGNGSVNLRGAVSIFGAPPGLYVQNDISGMTGGQLAAKEEVIGYALPGTFTQSAGTNTADELWIGSISSGVPPLPVADGTYVLSGTGSLTATTNLFIGVLGNGTYTQTGGTCSAPRFLQAALSASTQATISLSGGTLTTGCAWFALGNNSTCTFTHTGGTYHMPTLSFFLLGQGKSSVATYDLSAPGVLQLDGNSWESIGRTGKAIFTQTGGTHSVGGYVVVGGDAGSEGQYLLQGGDLAVGWYLAVAGVGIAKFTQSGGTATVDILRVAGCYTGGDYYVKSSSGVFILSNGQFTAGDERIGHYESGQFQHSGGKNTVTRALYLGDGSAAGNGTYTLSGTGVLAAVDEFIGNDGTGTLTHSAGTNTVTGRFEVGENAGSVGLYELKGTGTLSAVNETIGVGGQGTFTHSASANTLTGDLHVAENGGSVGLYELKGTGTLSAVNETIGVGGQGTFTHSASANTLTGSLHVGENAKSVGLYDLSGTGTLKADSAVVGGAGSGRVAHTASTFTVTKNLALGTQAGGAGTYRLDGSGTLAVGGQLQVGTAAGTARFEWFAGQIQKPAMTLGANGTLAVGFNFTVANLTTGALFSGGGNITGLDKATLEITGGAKATHQATTATLGALRIGGPDPGAPHVGNGTYAVVSGTLSVGSLEVGKASLGTLDIQDPAASVTVSGNLLFGANATFTAAAGTTIHFGSAGASPSHFDNQSTTPATLSGLGNLTLVFEGGGGSLDTFEVACPDIGADRKGLQGAFALHALTLGGAAIGKVQLVDKFDNQAGAEALYVETLTVGPGSYLDLNGLNLYALNVAIDPAATIVGGTVTFLGPAISGHVLTAAKAPVQGVTLAGAPLATATDANGYYSAEVSDGWSDTLTPQKAGYRFDPVSRTYANVAGDQTAQDFTAYPQWSLALAVQGDGTTDPAAGTYVYDVGTVSVGIKATAGTGMVFAGWGGDAVPSGHASDNPIFIPSGTVGQTKTLTAIFVPPQWTLAIQAPQGSGTTDPVPGYHPYAVGTASAAVQAKAAAGWVFDHWAGSGVPAGHEADNPITIPSGTLGQMLTLQAIFVQPWTLAIQAPSGSGTTDPDTGTYTYKLGAPSDAVTAKPATDWGFNGWTGNAVPAGHANDNPITIPAGTSGQTKTLKAVFALLKWTLDLQAPQGTGTMSLNPGPYSYDVGKSSVPIQATPGGGMAFLGWSGSAVPPGHEKDNPVTIPPGKASQTAALKALFGPPSLSVVATDASAAETRLGGSADTGQFTISRTGPTTAALSVPFTLTGTAKNGTDYTLSAKSPVLIPAGQASVVLTLTPKDDLVYKGSRTAILTLGLNPAIGLEPGKTSATVTLADNEPIVSIEATQPNAAEQGQVPGLFTVTRSPVAPTPLVVKFTIAGTAKNGTDYTKIASSVTILPNAASATIQITPKDDALFEPTETVILTLAASTAYGIDPDPANRTATVKIADNEPIVSIGATDPTAVEQGKDPGTFTVKATLPSGPSLLPITLKVGYAVSGTARKGTDYTYLPVSPVVLTIKAGDTTGTAAITITPKGNVLPVSPATAIFTLGTGAAYGLDPDPAKRAATVTITNAP